MVSFDNVQHDLLMARVARKVGDARLLALIGRYLRAGVIVGETFAPSEIGTPQGGPLSPLLANILLDEYGHQSRWYSLAKWSSGVMVRG